MNNVSTQHTYLFDALHDRGLAQHFSTAGGSLQDEAAVLGAAIRCMMVCGESLSNKELILQLIHALDVTTDPKACDIIRNTLEIVVGYTRDDI
ncbi:biofilm development regulator YmgB/AriR family protein [Leclercia sp. UBA2479]|uniref:biofilm development regulator YmgB/AriR family protein n=1 Tax=Leclercia sp. UBA2479 TaxID=1946738 RepID=UPI00257C3F61|nr:biofilm development regulator YmgB/AriR family protein [Leclercia sp. UBA2479]